MCGRYYLEDEINDRRLAEQIRQATHISAQLCANMKVSGEIRPTDIAPVLAPSADHRRLGAFPMQWGFNHPIHPFQDGNGRVGRLVALKECLRHGIIPFIIEDAKKAW